jgi:hypothetical protein
LGVPWPSGPLLRYDGEGVGDVCKATGPPRAMMHGLVRKCNGPHGLPIPAWQRLVAGGRAGRSCGQLALRQTRLQVPTGFQHLDTGSPL